MPESVEENVLVGAAKALGKAAGKIAALTGAEPKGASATAADPRIGPNGKYRKSEKPRLPRRLKKAQKKSRVR